MASNYVFRREDFLQALKEWFNGRYDPKVSFPDGKGFGNVAYLYDNNYEQIIEEDYQMMSFLQSKLNMPVVVFAEPLSRMKEPALTCDEWLNLVSYS